MNFHHAAALYKIGILPSEKMVDMAMSALESGAEDEEIVMLAIEANKTLGTLKPLFESCLKLFKLDSLSDEEVLRYAAQYFAAQAKSGEINEIEFGFKLGALHDRFNLEGELWDAYQNAMWYEEAPYEYGYAKDLDSLRKLKDECSKKIWGIIEVLSA